jgi:hypothetical protein
MLDRFSDGENNSCRITGSEKSAGSRELNRITNLDNPPRPWQQLCNKANCRRTWKGSAAPRAAIVAIQTTRASAFLDSLTSPMNIIHVPARRDNLELMLLTLAETGCAAERNNR